MNHWLIKSDPEDYAYDDLVRAKRDVWNGVRNNQALIYLRQMQKGDQVMVYHSGKDKAVMGLAEIVRGPYPDPEAGDEKWVVVDLKPTTRLPRPIPLSVIKADKAFARFQLVTISRLSVMPVPPDLWKKLCEMGGKQP